MPAIATYGLTGNVYIDGVLGKFKWAVNSFTYSFPKSGSYYGNSYGDDENTTNFGALNSAQKGAVDKTLKAYSAVANLSFARIDETATQHADLRFAITDETDTAWAYEPDTAPEGGDVWFNGSNGYYDSPARGDYASSVFLHETGHALGLDHPHEGDAMPRNRDSLEYAVMSYSSYVGGSTSGSYTNETWGYPQSLMMYDIAGVQHLYGANYATNSGNTIYRWSPKTGEMTVNGVRQGTPGDNRILQTIWDGGGKDTYNFAKYDTALKIDLRPGEWVRTSTAQLAKLHWDGSELAVGNIANALLYQGDPRSLIENAVGGRGDDRLTGNDAGNSLKGGAGADKLFGRAGSDVLDGGRGADTMSGGAGADIFDFNSPKDSPSAGRDTIVDFTKGVDRIDLRTMDANTTISGNQAFSFIGAKSFSGHGGQLAFSGNVLSGDVNGDKIADFRIHLPSVAALTKADFYL